MKQDPRYSNALWLVSTALVLIAAASLAQVRAQGIASTKVSVSACRLAWLGAANLCTQALPSSFELARGKKPSISTKVGGQVSLEFPNKTRVDVLQNSVFVIDSYAKDGVRGILKSGTISYRSSVQHKSDEIVAASTKIQHIGTSFLFSRTPEAGARSDAGPSSAKEVWREVDTKRAFKLGDLKDWKQRLAQACEQTCSPDVWKPNRYDGKIGISNFKITGKLSCACLVRTATDRDGDGVLDTDDACPEQPGSINEGKSLHGCPALLERVILLPDEDGKVGQLEVQDLKTGQVVAKLEQAYASAGITSDGAVVTPVIKETPESIAAMAPPSEPTQAPALPPEPAPVLPPEPAPVVAPVPSADQHCYWMSNAPPYPWMLRQDVNRRQCYELDSCDGGQGMSGGGCYKWAAGAEAPRQIWSELHCPDC